MASALPQAVLGPIAAFLTLASAPAHADRALLIGVGAYPDLPPSLRLEAPEEDARRLAEALKAAGFPAENITLMTAPAGRAPTRAAVVSELERIARTAVRGEQVLVYFSGHGAQMPTVTPALEPDGLDELYLMYDARGWDGGKAEVPGAILDKQMIGLLAAIRAGGADIWFVADACHAGGLYRGAPSVRAKAVAPAALGIPRQVAARAGAAPPADPPGAGRMAAFYAAGPDALAVERRLPPGSADARPLSQFSYALTRAIAAGRLRSLRDLAMAIGAVDAGLGGDAPEPQFDGALDMGVLGLTPDRPRRYPVAREARDPMSREAQGATIALGVEEGVAGGDRLALFAAGSDESVGEATVIESELGIATLRLPVLPAGAYEAGRLLGPGDVTQGATRGATLLDAIAPLAARGAAEQLAVRMLLWRPGAVRVCPPLSGGKAPAGTDAVQPLALPALGQCDILLIDIVNRGATPVDLSPLYVDAAGKVAGLGFVGGGSVRLEPGGTRRLAIRTLSEDRQGRELPVGVERLALVALPGTGAMPRDLRGAADATRGAGATLDAGAGALVYRWRVVR